MVFRVEDEFVGVAADGGGDGTSYGGAGYFAVEELEWQFCAAPLGLRNFFDLRPSTDVLG